MSRRRQQTHGDMVRDIVRRRRAREQQRLKVDAMGVLMHAGHTPLCAMHMPDTGKCRCEEGPGHRATRNNATDGPTTEIKQTEEIK